MLRYRYPGEQWAEIDADDFTIANGTSSPITYEFSVRVNFKAKVYIGSGDDTTGNPDRIYQIGLGGHFESIEGDERELSIPEQNRFYKLCGTYRNIFTNRIERNCSTTTRGLGDYFDLDEIEIVNFEYSSFTLRTCIFIALLDDRAVFSSNRDVCPEVEFISDEEECPPGTCKVRCGNVFCCYDTSTGIAVSSFEA